jgi:hypothetical protein
MALLLAAASPWVVLSVAAVVGVFSVWGAIRLIRRLERVAQERPVSAAVQRQRGRESRRLERHPLPVISNRRRLEIVGLPALGMFVVATVLGPLGQVGTVLSMATVALIFVLGATDRVQVGQTERALLVLAAIFSAVIGMSLGLAVG